MTSRDELKRLISELPDDRLAFAAVILRKLRDPTASVQDLGWLRSPEMESFPGSEIVRQAMRRALEEAYRAGSSRVDTGHILIAVLIADPAFALTLMTPTQVESVIRDLRGETVDAQPISSAIDDLPWSEPAKRAWDMACAHAVEFHGKRWVDSASLMLGLIEDSEGLVSRVLANHNIQATSIKTLLQERRR